MNNEIVFALMVVAALLVVAMPAAAQGPVMATTDQGPKPIFVRTAGDNVDPFGGLPLLSSTGGLGAASRYGVGGPFSNLIPGGKPSNKSGDGTAPRKAIYIGGAWSTVLPPDQKELPSCATITIPAGSSRWFKMDTWKDKKLQIWLDDELDGAKTPSGKAVFGAPSNYNWGTWSGSVWQQYTLDTPGDQTSAFVEGYAMLIYTPEAMNPNFAYPPPNAALYTLSRGDGSFARSSQGAPTANDGRGLSLAGIVGPQYTTWAEQNLNQPDHLLWHEGMYDGWVHARVFNQMIWNGTVSVCSYRASR